MEPEEKKIVEKEKRISRKEFFKDTSKYALGATIGVIGYGALANNKVQAETKGSQSWPYPYAALDPEVVRQYAHAKYWNGYACCAGTFGAIVQALSEAIGDPWTTFPIEIMKYGSAGVGSWGTLCGTLNGGAALISLVVSDSTKDLINELYGYYTTQKFPTDEANAATYDDHPEIGVLTQNISGSPLCHPSVSQWCFASGFNNSSDERKERCARLAGDIAAKTVTILNDYFASTFAGTYADPSGNADCLSCHGSSGYNNVSTHMECVGCHTMGADHGTSKIQETNSSSDGYNLENAFPNPFNNSTTLKFSLPEKGKVRLEIYDIKGILVSSLIDSEVKNVGTYEVTWNGRNNLGESVTNGVYLARFTTGNYIKTVKLNLLK